MEKKALEKVSEEDLAVMRDDLTKNKGRAEVQLQILEELSRKELNYELLSSTKIGKVIRGLAGGQGEQEAERKVARLSKELLQSWKAVAKDTKHEKKNAPLQEEGKESKGSKGLAKAMSNRYITGDETRDALRKKFIEILQTPLEGTEYVDEQLDSAIDVAMEIESLLFQIHKDRKQYSDKARSLIFNLRDPKNPSLRQKVLFHDYSPLQFVTSNPKELASDAKKQERDDSIKQNLDARRSDWIKDQLQKDASNKGFFQCKKCGSKNTSYYQMQTRGADEPMTNFITCLDCANNWKS